MCTNGTFQYITRPIIKGYERKEHGIDPPPSPHSPKKKKETIIRN